MLKTFIPAALALSAVLTISAPAGASPWAGAATCAKPASSHASERSTVPHLTLVRDTRASMSGGSGGSGGGSNGGSGGNANSCWSACFSTYNNCVDRERKDHCVSRMKSCLAICDTSGN
jgi:hypothetical protein